jgi:hypothetical protein
VCCSARDGKEQHRNFSLNCRHLLRFNTKHHVARIRRCVIQIPSSMTSSSAVTEMRACTSECKQQSDNSTLNCWIVTCIKCDTYFILKNCKQICKTYLKIYCQFPFEVCLCLLRINCSGSSMYHCIRAVPQI